MTMSNKISPVLQFSILSETQKEKVHLAALDVLRRTGVRVFSDEAVELLRKAGCHISEGNKARIPAYLVEEAVRTAPQSITIHDRNGKPAMFLEGTNAYYGTGSDLPYVIDAQTSERRRSVKKDIAESARLCDALPNISFIMSMALPSDVDIATSDLHSFEAMVANSTKPIVYTAHDRQGLSHIIDMAATVAGGKEVLQQRPFLTLYAEPSSPLRHSLEATEKLMLVAENNLPVIYAPGPIMGASSPVTMPATLVQANAEILSGILIAQLKRPGAPCLFGSGTPPLDMRTTVAAYSAPEHMLVTSAMVEMGRYYKLPTWGYGGDSDSKLFDEQAALEGTLWTVIAALNGANLLHDTGYVESGMTSSHEMLVAMDEIIGMVRRFTSGIEFDDESLALDVIDEVGPGGHYLDSDHTLRHFKEHWYPSLLDRQRYEDWAAAGKKTLRQRAHEKAVSILSNHQPEPLPEGIQERLAAIIASAEDRRGSRS